MARGRMVNQVLCSSRKFNELGDDSSRLTYILLLSFADREGRTEGDPCYVRSRIYPRRSDITDAIVLRHLDDIEAAGLILRYEHSGETVIQFLKFAENQAGLRADREPPSQFPAPPPAPDEPATGHDAGTMPERCRQNAGTMPASRRQKSAPLVPEGEGEVEGEFIPPPTPPGGRGLNLEWIDDPEWRELFRDWARNKKGPYKNSRGLKAGYARMAKISGGDITAAREIVERSIANGWQGLFPLPRGHPPQANLPDFEHRIE